MNAPDFSTFRVLRGPLLEVLCLRPVLSLSPFTAVDLNGFDGGIEGF